MKRTGFVALFAVPLAAIALTFSTGAAPGDDTDHWGAPTKHDTTTSQQCGKPASQRTGAWFCADISKSRQMMERSMAAKGQSPILATGNSLKPTAKTASPTVAESAADDGRAGWCDTVGCYWLITETPFRHMEYEATGFYGYGGTTLGSTSTTITNELLNSTDIKIAIQSMTKSRSSTKNSWADYMYRVNSSVPYGQPCGQSATQAAVNAGANTTVQWNGIYLKACADSTQSVFHRIYWRDGTSSPKPGRWYCYAKSVKFTHELGYQMHYQGSVDTPTTPQYPDKCGWENV